MLSRCCTTNRGFALMVAALVSVMPSTTAVAQCHGGGGGGHDHGAAGGDSRGGQPHWPAGSIPPLVERTPHGGLYLETGSHVLEVVYLPQETRVYLYGLHGDSLRPLSTLNLRGQMSPQIPGDSHLRQIPLQHVPPVGPQEQDYLTAAVDVTQLPDETPITFRFENFPDQRDSNAEFNPTFSRFRIRPYVARVSFVRADREGFLAQQTCPVTGARLGSMGAPVKVLVGERPLYLCCAGCIENVKESSDQRSAKSHSFDAVR